MGALDVFRATYAAPEGGDGEQGVGWSDWGKTLQAGGYDLAGQTAAFGRLMSEVIGKPEAAVKFAEAQRAAGENADIISEDMSETARRRAESGLGSSEFWAHPFSAGTLKMMRAAPSMAAAIAPTFAMPEIWGLMVGGAGLGAAQSIHDITGVVDKMPEEELLKNSRYRAWRELYPDDEKMARVKFDQDLIGAEPIFNGIVGALANVVGPGAKMMGVAKRGAGSVFAPEAGRLARTGLSAAEGAVGGAAMGGVGDVTTQLALMNAGVQQEFDKGRLANAIAEPALLGAAAGTVGGVLSRGKKPTRGIDVDQGLRPPGVGEAPEKAPTIEQKGPPGGPPGVAGRTQMPSEAKPTEAAPGDVAKQKPSDTKTPGAVEPTPGEPAPVSTAEVRKAAGAGVDVAPGMPSDQMAAMQADPGLTPMPIRKPGDVMELVNRVKQPRPVPEAAPAPSPETPANLGAPQQEALSRVQQQVPPAAPLPAAGNAPPAGMKPATQAAFERVQQKAKPQAPAPAEPQPVTMYHGSPTGDLKTFGKDFTFFTPNPAVAGHYAMGEIMGSARGQEGKANPHVYKAEVNPGNTLDLRKPEHRQIYELIRKEYNAKVKDPDERLPNLNAEGFIHSHHGVPGYGHASAILQEAVKRGFHSMLVSEGSQGISTLVHKAGERAKILEKTPVKTPVAETRPKETTAPTSTAGHGSLLEQAAAFVRKGQKATVDELAKGLGINKKQAGELMTGLEEKGVVSKRIPGKSRTIFPEEGVAKPEPLPAAGKAHVEEVPPPAGEEPPVTRPAPTRGTGRLLEPTTKEALARHEENVRATTEQLRKVETENAAAEQRAADAREKANEEAARAKSIETGIPAERKGKISKFQKSLYVGAMKAATAIWEAKEHHRGAGEHPDLRGDTISELKSRLTKIKDAVDKAQERIDLQVKNSGEYKAAAGNTKQAIAKRRALEDAAQIAPERVSAAHGNEQLMLRQALDLLDHLNQGKSDRGFIEGFMGDEALGRLATLEGKPEAWGDVRGRRLAEGEAKAKPKGEGGAELLPDTVTRRPSERAEEVGLAEELPGGRDEAPRKGEPGYEPPEQGEEKPARVKPDEEGAPAYEHEPAPLEPEEQKLSGAERREYEAGRRADLGEDVSTQKERAGRHESIVDRKIREAREAKERAAAEAKAAEDAATRAAAAKVNVEKGKLGLKKKEPSIEAAHTTREEKPGQWIEKRFTADDKSKYEVALAREDGPRPIADAGSQDVNKGAVSTLKTYRARDILRMLDMRDARSPLLRSLMGFVRDKMVKALEGTELHFVDDFDMLTAFGEDVNGIYRGGNDAIFIRRGLLQDNPAQFLHTVMHESLHALTTKGLLKDRVLIQRVRRLQDFVGKHFGDVPENSDLRYGLYQEGRHAEPRYNELINAMEFLAEAFGNQKFAERLAAIPLDFVTKRELGMFTWRKATVWDAFKDIVRQSLSSLGIKLPQNTALEAALGLTEQAAHQRLPAEKQKYKLNLDAISRDKMTPDERQQHDMAQRVINQVMHEENVIHREMMQHEFALVSRGDATAVANSFREVAEKPVETLGKIATAMMRAGRKITPAIRALTTNKDLGYWVRDRFKTVDTNDIMNAVERMGPISRELRKPGAEIIGDMTRLKRENPELFRTFQELLHDETMYGAEGSSELGQGRNKRLALSAEVRKKLAKGASIDDVLDIVAMRHREAISNHADLRERYRELVKADPRYAEMHERVLKFYEDANREMAYNHIHRLLSDNESFRGDPEAKARELLHRSMSAEDWDNFAKEVGDGTVEDIRHARQMLADKGPYMPLMRRGDFVVTGDYKLKEPTNGKKIRDDLYEFDTRKEAGQFADDAGGMHYEISRAHYDADGNRVAEPDAVTSKYQVKLERQYTSFHPSMAEAAAHHKELMDTGLFERLAQPAERREYKFMLPSEISHSTEASILKRLEQSKEYLNASSSQRATMRQSVTQGLSALQKGNRIQHRRLARRRVAGADRDIIQTMHDYNASQASYRARQEMQPILREHMRVLDEELVAREHQDGNAERHSAANEIRKRIEGETYIPDSNTKRATQLLSTVSYIARMARPSHIILQHVHFPLITGPVMAARHGIKAFPEFYRVWGKLLPMQTQGFKDAWKVMRDMTHEGQNYLSAGMNAIKDDKDFARVKQVLEHLHDINALHPDVMQQMERLEPGTGVLGKAESALARVDASFRQAASVADGMTKIASGIAAYRLEFEKLTRAGKSEEVAHADAIDYAEKVLHDTQGHYSLTNAAPLWKKPWAKPFLQFKQFTQMFYHLWATSLKDAFTGADRETKMQGLRQVALLTASHSLMAGTVGMLPWDAGRALVNTASAMGLTNSDWGDFETWQRDKLADMFGRDIAEYGTHGLTRMLGIDVTSRLGVGDMLTYGIPGHGATMKDWQSWGFSTLFGAPLGLARDEFQGAAQAFGEGRWGDGALKIIPAQALRDVAMAYHGGGQGDRAYKYGPGATVARVLGFTPAGEAQKRERTQELYQKTQTFSRERSSLIRKHVDAEPGQRASIETAIARWNDGKPKEQQITKGDLVVAKTRKVEQERTGKRIEGVAINRRTQPFADEYRRRYGEHP